MGAAIGGNPTPHPFFTYCAWYYAKGRLTGFVDAAIYLAIGHATGDQYHCHVTLPPNLGLVAEKWLIDTINKNIRDDGFNESV